MAVNPNTAAPANIPVLILLPGAKRVWMKAVLGEQKGRKGLRWRIFDKANRSWVYAKEFQPLDWMPLVPENGCVQ